MVLAETFRRNAASQDVGLANRALLEAVIASINDANTGYAELRNYWDGEHPTRLTDRLKQFLRLNTLKAHFADNFAGVVIAAATDRLAVQGFTVPGEEPDSESEPGPVAQFASDTWAINRCDAMQKDVYGDAMALGDAHVIVDWDAEQGERGGPSLSFNPPELVRITYDPGNYQVPLRAAKRWVVTSATGAGAMTGTVRLNLYFPDRIERYVSNSTLGGGNWQPFTDEDVTEWPVPWTMPGGEPIGIPVIHFRNSPRGATYGRSDLTDVLDLQDVVNKGLVDGVKVLDSQGWQQRWATGLETTPSEDLIANPGSFFHAGSADARFGQFDAADPTKIVAWMEFLALNIATISSTPHHLFKTTGGLPSGEALKTAEAPLVRKVQDRQIVFGNAWEDVMRMASRVSTANGTAIEVPDTGYSVEWEDAETRPSEKERIEAINLKEGISERQRWREYGYTDEEIERIMAEKEQEPNDIADALARAFDRGEGAAVPGGREEV